MKALLLISKLLSISNAMNAIGAQQGHRTAIVVTGKGSRCLPGIHGGEL